MKICFIISGLRQGGAERNLINLCANLPFPATIISLSSGGELVEYARLRSVHLRVIPLKLLSLKKFMRALSITLKELQPDLLFGWMYHGNLVATLASFLMSKPPQVFWGIRHGNFSFRDEKLLTSATFFLNVVVSRFTVPQIVYCSYRAKEWHEAFGYCACKSLVISNGVSHTMLRRPPSTVLKGNKNPPTILIVGRFAKQKGIINLIRIISRVRYQKNMRLLLVGRGMDTQNTQLAQAIKSLEKNISVELRGFVSPDQMIDIYDQSDAYLCGALHGEAFPNALAEAMARGLVPLVTDVGDSKFIINKYGVCVDPKNVEQLGEVIENYLLGFDSKTDKERQEEKENIQRYMELFDEKIMFDRYIKLLKSGGLSE